ncbi:putative membrane protein [Clostridioides difficile DA00132]|nr:putative membrane protein [Clostridioides difficile DA00132]
MLQVLQMSFKVLSLAFLLPFSIKDIVFLFKFSLLANSSWLKLRFNLSSLILLFSGFISSIIIIPPYEILYFKSAYKSTKIKEKGITK